MAEMDGGGCGPNEVAVYSGYYGMGGSFVGCIGWGSFAGMEDSVQMEKDGPPFIDINSVPENMRFGVLIVTGKQQLR